MRPFHHIIAILGSAMIVGCGGASKDAKSAANEQADYNWADYKGTYAPGSPASKGQADTPPPPKKEAKTETQTDAKASDAKPEKASDAKVEDDDAKPAGDDPPKKKKKKKKGGVAGASKSPSAGTPKKAPRKRAKR